ncbi:MAG: hypothetical protein ACRDJW_22105 [Thermomicrobiales bacterium]
MLGSAQPMIEAMLQEFHNPREAARLRPYYTGHRRDLTDDGEPARQEETVGFVDRLVATAVDRARAHRPRSRSAASSC